MIKTLYVIGISIFLTTPLFAASGNFSTTNLVTLFLALAALTIGIVNYFRINRVHKIHEVDFMNQKEDFALSLERFKSSLSQGQRNQNKEFNRQPNAPKNMPDKSAMKPNTKSVATEAEVKTEKSAEVKTETPRNPKPKKKYYHRRRPGSSGEKSAPPKE